MQTETTTGLIYQLIPQLMSAIGAVAKGRRNQQQGYAFRGIDDLLSAVQGPFAAAGVFAVPQVMEQAREERATKNGGVLIYTILKVRITFYASDGSSVEAVTVGEAMDTADKSCNKAMSTAMKYALIQVFSIPTEAGDDTENASHEVRPRQEQRPARPAMATAAQIDDLRALLGMVSVPAATVDKWLAKSHASRFEEMPAAAVQACIEYVRAKVPANTTGELREDPSTSQEPPRNGRRLPA